MQVVKQHQLRPRVTLSFVPSPDKIPLAQFQAMFLLQFSMQMFSPMLSVGWAAVISFLGGSFTMAFSSVRFVFPKQ